VFLLGMQPRRLDRVRQALERLRLTGSSYLYIECSVYAWKLLGMLFSSRSGDLIVYKSPSIAASSSIELCVVAAHVDESGRLKAAILPSVMLESETSEDEVLRWLDLFEKIAYGKFKLYVRPLSDHELRTVKLVEKKPEVSQEEIERQRRLVEEFAQRFRERLSLIEQEYEQLSRKLEALHHDIELIIRAHVGKRKKLESIPISLICSAASKYVTGMIEQNELLKVAAISWVAPYLGSRNAKKLLEQHAAKLNRLCTEYRDLLNKSSRYEAVRTYLSALEELLRLDGARVLYVTVPSELARVLEDLSISLEELLP